MAQFNVKVQPTDLTAYQFNPTDLQFTVGNLTDDLKNITIHFTLLDKSEWNNSGSTFDASKYTLLEKMYCGTMLIPVDIVSTLLQEDGSYNYDVMNQLVQIAYLELIQPSPEQE